MRKRKNGERNYRKIFLKTIIGIIVIALLTLSIPTLYSIVTYYHLPDSYDKPPTSDWYTGSEAPYQICVNVAYVGGYMFMPDALSVRLVIDDEVVPVSEIEVKIYHHIPHWMDITFPSDDVVCTTQPDLSVGEHEVIVFRRRNFEWQPLFWKWIVHVDKNGVITNS